MPKHEQKAQSAQLSQEKGEAVEPEAVGCIEELPDFNALYTTRMERMERKNEAKQEYLSKKQELRAQLEKKPAQGHLLSGGTDIVDRIGIRYLIFKNWSGNHIDIELCDRGYKYRFTNGVAGLVKHLLEENGFVEGFGQEGLIIWNIGVIGSAVYQSLGAYQKINHFPKSFEITRKDLMLQNLSKMKHRFARE